MRRRCAVGGSASELLAWRHTVQDVKVRRLVDRRRMKVGLSAEWRVWVEAQLVSGTGGGVAWLHLSLPNARLT